MAYCYSLLFRSTIAKPRGRSCWRRRSPGIRYNEHIDGDGQTIFAYAKMKLAVFSERLDSRYRSGRAKTWIKVKNKLAPAYMRVIDGIS